MTKPAGARTGGVRSRVSVSRDRPTPCSPALSTHALARRGTPAGVLPFAHGPHTFPRMRFLLACLASLALVGCNGSRTEDPAVDEEALFGPAAMRIHPIFTDVKDWTGDDKADGVEVL